jgi:inosine-uridine nucleoside N-ribohydrolase
MPLDVWIDTDPAVGVPNADVDDGFALVQAFHSPELRVRGVSAVFGNAPLSDTLPITEEIVGRFGPPGLAVHAGAAGAIDLHTETAAVTALARALEAAPLDVLALGPVTTVAGLALQHPELAPRIRRIVCVAARRPGQEFRSTPAQPAPFPDLNFECDPSAMRVLLESAIPLVFAGWEVASHVWLTEADLDRLAAGGEAASWLALRARPWLSFWTDKLRGAGFNPFDTLAIGVATTPDLIATTEVGVTIEDAPGAPLLVAHPDVALGRAATYCTRPSPAFKDALMERLAR